jgi:hypothetical protein
VAPPPRRWLLGSCLSPRLRASRASSGFAFEIGELMVRRLKVKAEGWDDSAVASGTGVAQRGGVSQNRWAAHLAKARRMSFRPNPRLGK